MVPPPLQCEPDRFANNNFPNRLHSPIQMRKNTLFSLENEEPPPKDVKVRRAAAINNQSAPDPRTILTSPRKRKTP